MISAFHCLLTWKIFTTDLYDELSELSDTDTTLRKKKKEKLCEHLRPFTYSLLSDSGLQRGEKLNTVTYMLTGTVLKEPTAYHDKVWDVLHGSTTCCFSIFFSQLRQSHYIWAINSANRQSQADSCPGILWLALCFLSCQLSSFLPWPFIQRTP